MCGARCFGAGSCGNAVPAASAEYVAPNRCLRHVGSGGRPVPASGPGSRHRPFARRRTPCRIRMVSGARRRWGGRTVAHVGAAPTTLSQVPAADGRLSIRRRVNGSFENGMATQIKELVARRSADAHRTRRSGGSRATRSRSARSGPFACSASGCDSPQKGSDESERVRHSLPSETKSERRPGESLYSSARDRP
mgnify:CR=1 FL=1